MYALRPWLTATSQLLPLLREPRVRWDAARAILRITGTLLRVTLRLTWRATRTASLATPIGLAGSLLGRRRRPPRRLRQCSSCQHTRHAHDHYRRGSDCGLCGCASYRR